MFNNNNKLKKTSFVILLGDIEIAEKISNELIYKPIITDVSALKIAAKRGFFINYLSSDLDVENIVLIVTSQLKLDSIRVPLKGLHNRIECETCNIIISCKSDNILHCVKLFQSYIDNNCCYGIKDLSKDEIDKRIMQRKKEFQTIMKTNNKECEDAPVSYGSRVLFYCNEFYCSRDDQLEVKKLAEKFNAYIVKDIKLLFALLHDDTWSNSLFFIPTYIDDAEYLPEDENFATSYDDSHKTNMSEGANNKTTYRSFQSILQTIYTERI